MKIMHLGKECCSSLENSIIDDSKISTDTTYSSDKINSFLPFKLGITEDGQYGYYKDGADTVTPFRHDESGLTALDHNVIFKALDGEYILCATVKDGVEINCPNVITNYWKDEENTRFAISDFPLSITTDKIFIVDNTEIVDINKIYSKQEISKTDYPYLFVGADNRCFFAKTVTSYTDTQYNFSNALYKDNIANSYIEIIRSLLSTKHTFSSLSSWKINASVNTVTNYDILVNGTKNFDDIILD